MKYCYNCDRITAGEPLFCNFCGRSYDVKLCPRMHPNPRKAQACSKCGSRDFSTPQPKVPWWAPLLEIVLSSIPGVILTLASVLAVLAVLREILTNPAALVALALPLISLAILWGMWKQIPAWFRKAIYDLLKRKRDRDDGRDR
jgi:hypothetical protein